MKQRMLTRGICFICGLVVFVLMAGCANQTGVKQVYLTLDSFKNVTFVHLVADDEDLKIRCKLTNEPTFNLERDKKAFKDQFDKMVKDGFDVMTINTSHFTPYKAAKLIVQHMEAKNS